MQLATPSLPAWLLMETLARSEVDHWPCLSGSMGQFPLTEEVVLKRTWFPGGAAAWSAAAVAGWTCARMVQLWLSTLLPQLTAIATDVTSRLMMDFVLMAVSTNPSATQDQRIRDGP